MRFLSWADLHKAFAENMRHWYLGLKPDWPMSLGAK